MLVCAACGEHFSPWAARCPECGRSAGDAASLPVVESTAPEAAIGGESLAPAGRAAAAVAERPAVVVTEDPAESTPAPVATAGKRRPRPHYRWLIVLLVVVVVWVAVAVTLQMTSGGSNRTGKALPGWVHSLPGRVVSVNAGRTLLLSAPDGSQAVAEPTPADFDTPSGLMVAPDGRYIADAWGDLLGTQGWRVVSNNIAPVLDPSIELAAAPFSAGSQALVVLSTGSTTSGALAPQADVSLVWPADPHVTPLGPADDAAGDPRAPGAFITVAASRLDPGGLYQNGVADRAVELVDVGVPARPVIASGQLNRDLHQAPAIPVSLTVYPDPAGDKLAIVVTPISSGHRALPAGVHSGVVIVDRSGHLIGVGPALNGPGRWQGTSLPVWSPDGRSLVYVPSAARGPEIVEWTIGGKFRTRPVANLANSASCLWAPNSAAILCPTGPGLGPGQHWLLANVGGGSFVPVAAQGAPVAWIASGTAPELTGRG